jgi:hypothetical protein
MFIYQCPVCKHTIEVSTKDAYLCSVCPNVYPAGTEMLLDSSYTLDSCPSEELTHVHRPDWTTARKAEGTNPTDNILDVWCKCGHSGSMLLDPRDINW